jgi:hypothetical protein
VLHLLPLAAAGLKNHARYPKVEVSIDAEYTHRPISVTDGKLDSDPELHTSTQPSLRLMPMFEDELVLVMFRSIH